MTVLHMLQHASSIGRRGRDNEVFVGETRNRAIVEDKPVFAQHYAVARAAHGQSCECIGVKAVQKFRRVGTLQINPTKCRHITDPDLCTYGLNLSVDALEPIRFVCSRIPLRTQPVSSLDEDRALFLRPAVGRRQTARSEVTSTMQSCHSSNCNGRKGRSVGCGPRLRYAARGQLCHQCDPDEPGSLALICCHSERCVAFEMLGAAKALALSQSHVLVADIILQVDKRFATPAITAPKRRLRAGFGLTLG